MTEFILYIWDWLGNNAAEIIALCALTFVIYEARKTREHNKLSVKPFLTYSQENHFDKNSGTITLSILNNGLGTAEIIDYKMLFNGEEIDYDNHVNTANRISEIIEGINIESLNTGYLYKGKALKAGDSFTVFDIAINTPHSKWEDICNSFRDLHIKVTYRSMYKETDKLDTEVILDEYNKNNK